MAGGRKSGSDFALEGRHLVGLFLLLVVIFGMVFTLGYMLGRNQSDSHLRAAAEANADLPPTRSLTTKPSSPKAPGPPANPSTSTPSGSAWDFYHSADATVPDHVLDAPQPNASDPLPSATFNRGSARAGARSASNSALIPKGTIMLQVAALKSESDALALAQALQQKRLPAVVIPPGPDNYYHVQVGPYKSAQAAAAGRDVLEAQGFKSITKR